MFEVKHLVTQKEAERMNSLTTSAVASKKSLELTKKEILVEPSSKKKDDPRKPPFDFFGVTPKFFINKTTKTLTWLGFLCTLFLVGSIVTVFIFYFSSYLSKESSIVTSINMISDEKPYIDLKEQE